MAVLGKVPTGRIGRYFALAARYAAFSDHSMHKMGAIVVRKGDIIGRGFNKNRSHPRSKSYENMIHAELAALLNAGFLWGTHSSHLYIVRVTRGGAFGTSKPCSDCVDLMKEAGVEFVTYIDANGKIKEEML